DYGQPGAYGAPQTGSSYTAPLVSYAQAGAASLPPGPGADYLPPPVQAQPRTAPGYPPAPAAGPWNLTGAAASPSAPWGPAQGDQPRSLRTELAELQQERSPDISVGTTIRSRDGEPGMSGFTDVQ